MLLCLLLYNERKDYDDLIGALSRRQKVICVERILEQKNTNKLLERKERKEERERRASSASKKKRKKKMKKLALATLSVKFLSK